jgi:NADH:ubiquinone oxidoreductase subunit 4 (subunit M)
MLRAYRSTFMGTLPDRWSKIVDLSSGLRIPIALLVAGLMIVGFFPQTAVNIVTPVFRNYFVASGK